MGYPRRLLGDDEELVLVLRPHIKVLFGPVVLFLLLAAVAGLLTGYAPDGSTQPWVRLAIAVVALMIAARWAIWPFARWWTTVYAITNQRLITRTGVFSRSGHDMPLTRLNDISFAHNLWERMLGCGTLIVESAGERGQLVLNDIPKVEKVQRTLYELSEAARDEDEPDYRRSRDDLSPPRETHRSDETPTIRLPEGRGQSTGRDDTHG